MTENERIAKVLGWKVSVGNGGLGTVVDAQGRSTTGIYRPYGDPMALDLPDWLNDIAACFRDLVPWMQQRMAEAKLGWVHSQIDLRYESEGVWECEIAYPDADPLGDYLFEAATADTPAAAICAAFLDAFDPKNEAQQ